MIHPPDRRRSRIGQASYEATARIVSQTAEDGSPLDTPLELSRCAPGEECQSLPMTSAERAAAADRAIAAAMARDGADTGGDTGGNGSGGFYPFGGGLPLKLPTLPKPLKYLLIALAVAGVAAFVVNRRRR